MTEMSTVAWLRRAAVTGVIGGVVLVYLAFRARRAAERPRTAYWSLLGAVTIAIAVQGWLGGSFMHGGLNHLAF